MKPYDAETTATRAGLERFMRALVVVGGHFTDSSTIGQDIKKPSRCLVVFRVWLPEDRVLEFAELAAIELPKPAPQVYL